MAAPMQVFENWTSDCASPAWPLSVKIASDSDCLSFSVAWLLSADQ